MVAASIRVPSGGKDRQAVHRIISKFVVLTVLASAAVAQAPAKRRLTLQECIAIAQGQNPQLLASLEAEQAARWRYYQQRALYTPAVNVQGLRRRQTVPPALGAFAFGSPDVIDQQANLNHTIWSFGRFEAGLHARRQASRAAKSDADDTLRDVEFRVALAFYSVLLSHELVRVSSQTVGQVQLQLEQALKTFEAGTSARFDVVRARTQLANARPPLIRAQANERISRQTLLTVMGVPEELEFELAGDFDTRPVLAAQDRLLEMAWESRPDLAAANQRVRAAGESVREALAGDNPTVTFNGQTDKSLGQRPPFDSFVEINSATVSYNVPVFDGGVARARAGEARAEQRRLQHAVQALKNTIRLEVVQALARLDEARAVIQASGEALKEADEAVEIAEAGYQQGLRTNLEVLDAQLARDTSRTNYAQARHDYSVARARLEQVIGRSLPGERDPARAASAAAQAIPTK